MLSGGTLELEEYRSLKPGTIGGSTRTTWYMAE